VYSSLKWIWNYELWNSLCSILSSITSSLLGIAYLHIYYCMYIPSFTCNEWKGCSHLQYIHFPNMCINDSAYLIGLYVHVLQIQIYCCKAGHTPFIYKYSSLYFLKYEMLLKNISNGSCSFHEIYFLHIVKRYRFLCLNIML
jgi:hypothetical protein